MWTRTQESQLPFLSLPGFCPLSLLVIPSLFPPCNLAADPRLLHLSCDVRDVLWARTSAIRSQQGSWTEGHPVLPGRLMASLPCPASACGEFHVSWWRVGDRKDVTLLPEVVGFRLLSFLRLGWLATLVTPVLRMGLASW